jgi:uncharacterized protein
MIKSERGLAVVTGAAGGLGASFAMKLAERGHRLLLVDRRQNQLEEVCDAIASRYGKYGAHADPFAADLSKRDEVELLADRLEHMGDVELLVNNAGFGTIDYFVDTDPRQLVSMVDVHVVTPTILTRAVLPGMLERNRGSIINVSSLGAFFQSAGNAQYGATKCYLASFSMSLHQELQGTNVNVQALCPGFVRTQFHDSDGMKSFNLLCSPAAHMWMTPDEVVDCSLRQLGGKQVVVFPGIKYRLLGRLAQMPLLRPLMQRFTRLPRMAPSQEQRPARPAEPRPEPVLNAAKRA